MQVQLNHNRRKSDAIKDLLQADNHYMEQAAPPATAAGTSEAEDDLVAKYASRRLSPGHKSATY